MDNVAGDKLDDKLRDDLSVLNMLPISKVILAKRSSDSRYDWILFDVYRLGIGDYGLELTRLGFICEWNSTMAARATAVQAQSSERRRMYQVSGNFLSSRRRNLKGVSIICGLVVSSSPKPNR